MKFDRRKLFSRAFVLCLAIAAFSVVAGWGMVWSSDHGAMVEMLAASAQSSKPNIVMIVLDDIGFADFRAYGSEIRTPNIDALAQEGLRYNHFDTKAICSATRAALLTGRNNQTVRIENITSLRKEPDPNDYSSTKGELPLNVEFLPEALRQVGYRTVALGKWHLAAEYEDGSEGRRAGWPLQRGFDYWYGFGAHANQWHPHLSEGNASIPTPNQPGYHLSVDLTDRAIEAMNNPSQPMFLYLGYGAAHYPHHVPAEYRERYKGRYDRGWDVLRQERFERMKQMGIIPQNTILPERNPGDAAWSSLTAQQKRIYARFMENYAGFIEHTDEQIGRLLSALKSSGQYDNTLFVLLSDNGPAQEGRQTGTFRNPEPYLDQTPLSEMDAHLDELGGPTTNPHYQRPWAMAGATPFRRYKKWPFAGGNRDPLIIAWPGVITDKGAIRTQYIDVIDVAPTLLEAVGGQFRDVIDDRPQIPVAGKSMLATFTSATAPGRDVQFFSLIGNRGITSGDWKAIAIHKLGTAFDDDQWLLFDLSQDFSESTDVSAQHPEKLAELKALWWSEVQKYALPPIYELPAEVVRLTGGGEYIDAFSVSDGKPR